MARAGTAILGTNDVSSDIVPYSQIDYLRQRPVWLPSRVGIGGTSVTGRGRLHAYLQTGEPLSSDKHFAVPYYHSGLSALRCLLLVCKQTFKSYGSYHLW